MEQRVAEPLRLGTRQLALEAEEPTSVDETLLDEVDDRGPAEEWADWQEWVDRRDRTAG